ncbi:MAG: hypothetical protein ABR909_06980 [Candidatus Bathyarchaeia archaeon]|jgi:hypothetical protein
MNYEFLMAYRPPLSADQIAEISDAITKLVNQAVTAADTNANKRAEELLQKAETETQ